MIFWIWRLWSCYLTVSISDSQLALWFVCIVLCECTVHYIRPRTLLDSKYTRICCIHKILWGMQVEIHEQKIRFTMMCEVNLFGSAIAIRSISSSIRDIWRTCSNCFWPFEAANRRLAEEKHMFTHLLHSWCQLLKQKYYLVLFYLL